MIVCYILVREEKKVVRYFVDLLFLVQDRVGC